MKVQSSQNGIKSIHWSKDKGWRRVLWQAKEKWWMMEKSSVVVKKKKNDWTHWLDLFKGLTGPPRPRIELKAFLTNIKRRLSEL